MNFLFKSIFFSVFLCVLLVFPSFSQDLEGSGPVEINGDTVEFLRDKNMVIAKGNVEINYKNTQLNCDQIEFSRDTQIGHAVGNVRLKTEYGEITGNEINFDYSTMTGDFMGAKIYAHPYYAAGEKLTIEKDKKIVLTNAYATTSDYDKPEFRIASKKIEVFPGDKLVARNVTMKLGDLPMPIYLPRYTHRLDDHKPKILFTPGVDGDWGIFLLSSYRYYINENVKGTLHLDYRELLNVAGGADLEYKTDDFGSGLFNLYYAGERKIDADRAWDKHRSPTLTTDRFKAEWRHKWLIDESTTAIMQYYKLSDATFLKDYFEKEYQRDSQPDTFFLLTRSLEKGIISLRSDVRVNKFFQETERLPELRYDLSNVEIGESGFYFKNVSSFANLVEKGAAPSDFEQRTKRFDTDSEVSYPFKISFLEIKPFVGGRNTYYSQTTNETDVQRGYFKTGTSLSTKFSRLFDVNVDNEVIQINKLRHIITPSINYSYTSNPTFSSSRLLQFDSIDDINRAHTVNLALENKLQTKRDGVTVDLLRFIVDTDYRLKEDFNGSGFDFIRTDVDFRPIDWMTLYFDFSYDTRNAELDTANFDFYINGPDNKWSLGLGKRYNKEVDDQITTQFNYRINPKWAFKAFERFDIEQGELREQEYVLTRDLHAWEMDLKINDKINDGTEFLTIFRLKAFPEATADFGTTFERQKSGSEPL